MNKINLPIVCLIIITSCNPINDKSDAYGNFEVIEVMVSSESQGIIKELTITEGDHLEEGDYVGLTDTSQLFLQKQQLQAQKDAVYSKLQHVNAQIDVQKAQKQVLLKEKRRLEKLIKDGAATQKKLDDINGKLDVTEKQIQSIKTQKISILSETEALEKQIQQVNDKLNKCRIINPVKGTVLERYQERGEMASPAKAVYKIANLDEMILRAYVDGSQLPHIHLGQKAEVIIDKNKKENQKLTGTVTWISPEAEFTPKIIQTKKERVNLVYAVKIKVKNNGEIKIGMPA